VRYVPIGATAVNVDETVGAFIGRWKESGAGERGNFQSFLIELCDLLGVARPDPSRADERDNAYVFEKAVRSARLCRVILVRNTTKDCGGGDRVVVGLMGKNWFMSWRWDLSAGQLPPEYRAAVPGGIWAPLGIEAWVWRNRCANAVSIDGGAVAGVALVRPLHRGPLRDGSGTASFLDDCRSLFAL
jgi:hypothetical protein